MMTIDHPIQVLLQVRPPCTFLICVLFLTHPLDKVLNSISIKSTFHNCVEESQRRSRTLIINDRYIQNLEGQLCHYEKKGTQNANPLRVASFHEFSIALISCLFFREMINLRRAACQLSG